MHPVVEYTRNWQHSINDERIAATNHAYDVEVVKNIPYIEDGNDYHLLDIFMPAGNRKKLPVIMEVHGGGYIACFKEINTHHARYLASKGNIVVNMNYTLYPEADLRTPVNEIFTALDWIYQHSDAYLFDLSNGVNLVGDSAGGHLVLLAAAAQSNPASMQFFGTEKLEHKFMRFAPICPNTDLRPLSESDDPQSLGAVLKDMLKIPGFGLKTSHEGFLQTDFPETFIVTTQGDELLYSVAKNLHTYMLGKEIRHIYKEYDSVSNPLDHVFNVLHPEYVESIAANDDIINFFNTGRVN